MFVALGLAAVGLRTAMTSTGVLPADASARVGYQLQRAFGLGAPAELQVVSPASASGRIRAALAHTTGVAVAGRPSAPALWR